MDTALLDVLAKNWWAIALRGVAAIIFGILAAVMPGITLAVVVLLFGAYALVEGVLNVIAAVRRRGGKWPWWALLLEGVVSIAAGVVAFLVPGVTALALIYVIGAWAIVTGMLEIVEAVRLRRVITGEWWLAISGVLSLIFGAFLLVFPGAGAVALVLWVGIYAFIFGVLLVALALRLRRHGREVPRTIPHAA
jgi:uncharacterized membrane protein HdeD (DUF308 family)